VSGHTPGPWRQEGLVVWNANTSSVIVNVAGFHAGIEEDLANARLIAAAPDLLEALVDMLEHPSDYAINAALEAIRKARGEP